MNARKTVGIPMPSGEFVVGRWGRTDLECLFDFARVAAADVRQRREHDAAIWHQWFERVVLIGGRASFA